MRTKAWVFVIIALLGALIAAYFLWRWNAEPLPLAQEIAPPSAVAPAPPPASPPVASSEPAILHPLETTSEIEPLPEPGQSDQRLFDALAKALGKEWSALILPDALIRHIVVTVDNLPRKHLPAAVVPLKRAPGAFETSGNGDVRSIGPRNSARYTSYVEFAQSIDTPKLVAVYRLFYPLFQRAYVELGYPKAYFNDRLVQAIDDLLAAPELEEPARLVQPKVLYEFADPDLQARSAGQKIMIRIGRDNAAPIKTKLREIRQQVTRSPEPG